MAGYKTTEFLELMRHTLPVLEKDTIRGVMAKQDYTALDMLISDNPESIPGGTHLEHRWYYDLSADTKSERWFNPGVVRPGRLTNNSQKAQVPIANGGYSVSYIEHEILRNRDEAQILDILKARRTTELIRYLDGVDNDLWSIIDGTNSATELFGFPMWIVPITSAQIATSTAAGAFQGYNIATDANSTYDTTGSALVDKTTYTDFANWNAGWTNSSGEIAQVDRERIAECMHRMKFKAPKMVKDLEVPTAQKSRIFTGSTIWKSLGNVKEQMNDNIGIDITRYRYSHLINGVPVTRTYALDSANSTYCGTNPMYFIDFDQIKFGVDKKKWMRHATPQLVPGTDDCVQELVSCECQMIPKHPQCGSMINWAE